MSEASSEATGGIAESDNADSAQETAEEEASADDVAGDSMDSELLRPEVEDPPSSPKTTESPSESPFYEDQTSIDEMDSSNATDDASLTEDSSAVRLDAKKLICVRKDLFPKVRLPKLVPVLPEAYSIHDELTAVSCVKLDTDFEQSIDDVSDKKSVRSSNGIVETMSEQQIRPRKHRPDGDSIQDTNFNVLEDYKQNGCLPPESKRRKSGFKHKKRSLSSSRRKSSKSVVPHHAKGGKNMNTLQSNLVYDMDDDSSESFDSVDNMALLPRQPNSGKPLSHHMSQLAALEESKRIALVRSLPIVPSGGKPRSMMGITSSSNKKKSNKKNSAATYQSQISVDTNTIKIRIKKSSSHSQMETKSIGDVGLRRCTAKRKKPLKSPSSSSGEEYDPSRGDIPPMFSSAGARPRPVRKAALQTRKDLDSHEASVSPEPRSRGRHRNSHSSSYKGLWGRGLPPEVLSEIFQYVVSGQGALPTLISLGSVCKLWRVATMNPNLWRYVDLATYTREIWKTDYKLAWLLENRLSKCLQLNLSHWKVTNQTWICACIVEYSPLLRELNLTGWKRLSAENLKDIVDGLQYLERIDLSFTSDTGSSGSCLSTGSMTYFAQTIGSRLTHLTLANNKFAGLTQILIALATFCSSLELLDVSGVLATSHPASIPLEKLQKGCRKLRVFRAANSQLVLGTAATVEQMESPGFACLEELSVACPSSDYKFIDDDALGRILKTSTALRLLDVRGCLRISDSGLVRVPAWDLQHLFLSGCSVTRQKSSCLELILEKWSHSLLEVDLQWATATRPLDSAIEALADKGDQSQLRILNLCGSAVSLEPVKKVLLKCPKLESINLSSCRGFPRGMKRLYSGVELQDLKDSIDPVKIKEKEEQKRIKDKKRKSQEEAEDKIKEDAARQEANIKEEGIVDKCIPKKENEAEAVTKESEETVENIELKTPYIFRENVNIDEKPNITDNNAQSKVTSAPDESGKTDFSPAYKEEGPKSNQSSVHQDASPRLTPKNYNLDQFSPSGSGNADSSVQIKPEISRTSGWHSKQISPVTKPDSQQITQMSPETVKQEHTKASSSWNLGQFNQIKQDSQYRQVSPDTRQQAAQDNQKPMGNWNLEQFSPAPQKGSPENLKQEAQKAGGWNVGQYSPMTRQDGQYASQQSPYSAQPSPAQPSPAQPSPYSAQPSPYSAQPSPYSAQPSPDTSQAVKQEAPKSTWNLGQFSPMAKQISQYSSQPSPDTGNASKEKIATSWNLGQFSPMTRQEGQFASQQSPYSPRPSPEAMKQEPQKPISSRKSKSEQFSSQRSPGMGKFSPMVRPDCSIPSHPNPDTGQISRNNRAWSLGQFSPMPAPVTMPSPDTSSGKVNAGWSLGPFSPVSSDLTQNIVPKPNQMWNVGHFNMVHPKSDSCPSIGQSVPEGHHFETKSNQGQWSYNQPYDVLADLQQHMDTGQTVSKSMNSWNLGQFNLGQATSSVHPDFQMSSSVNAQCAWSDNSGYMNNPLIPTSVQGMCAKSDKDRTAYGVMDAVNPVTTSCAVSQISSMLQAPMEPLNGPSRID